jgi:tetratricopeptide (TPR) repeat protein
MKKFLIIIMLLIAGNLYAQDPVVVFYIKAKNESTNKNLPGVTIEIYQDGKKIQTSTTNSKGKVNDVEVPVGHVYQIKFKKDGFVTKMAQVDARYDTPEDLEYVTGQTMEVALFESVEGVDFSFLETTPMISFEFSPDGYQFDYDVSYTKQMLKKIEDLKKQIDEKREELAKEEAERAKTEADFNAYVKAGDNAVSQKKYQTAVEQYDLALALIDDAGVKAKRDAAQKELDNLAAQAQKDKEYQAKMGEAKQAFDAKDYQKAIGLYTEASKIKSNEQEPKDQIAKIQKLLADQKAQKDKFDQLVADGDNAVSSENYDNAISKYTEALGLFDDAEVKTKLENAKKLKADKANAEKEEAEKKAKFDALVSSADNLFQAKDFNKAKEKYLEAQNYFPEDNHVKQRLAEVDQKLAEQKAKEEEAKQKEEAYIAKMAEAKAAFDAKDYNKAIELYTKASEIKTTADEPKEMIKQINQILKDQAAKEEEFNKLVQEGDVAKQSELYDDAIDKYNKALDIKNDADVKAKKAEAEKLKQEKIDAENKANELEANYKSTIDVADKAYDNKNWEVALAKYNEALELKPGESHPTERIADINKKIADQKAKEAEAKAKQKKYDDLIAEADNLFSADKLNDAKEKYIQASKVFPSEDKPKDKISEINALLIQREAQAKKDAEYTAAMEKANAFFADKKYQDALSEYNKALGVYPEKTEPQDQINKINTILANQKSAEQREKDYQAKMKEGNEFFASNNLTNALSAFNEALSLKEGDAAAQAKIDEVNAKIKAEQDAAQLKKEIDELIKKGNTAFDTKDYQTAKVNYQKAIDLKNGDAVLEQKIKDIDALIAQSQNQAEQQAKFDAAIKEADNLYNANEFEKALAKYELAKSIMPSQHADERIIDIKNKLADIKKQEALEKEYNDLITKAQGYESNEDWQNALETYKLAYNKKQTAEINAKIGEIQTKIDELNQNKSKEENYKAKIALADAKFIDGEWLQAIEYYNQAKSIDGSKSYPDEQITLAQQNIIDEKNAAKNQEYGDYITKADGYFSTKDYDQAVVFYKKALGVKSEEQHPKDRLAEIEKIRNQANQIKDVENKKEQEYKALVQQADQLFFANDYKKALEKYLEAQNIKPTDGYVIKKIEDINSALANEAKNNAKREQFNKLVAEADAQFSANEWSNAKAKYEESLMLFPSEQYPRDQIVLCDNNMKSESSSEENKAYQKLLTVAQKKFDNGDYTKAKELYVRAKGMNPGDDLPPRRINEIDQIIKNKKIEDEYQSLIQKADNLFETQKWKEARPIYQQAYNVKNDSYPQEQIAKIDAKLGGFNKEQYDKMIAKADEYFSKANYEKAIGLYERAIKFQPTWDNSYPNAQITKINGILHPPKAKKTNLRNLGEKVVGLSEEDMEKMLMNDENTREAITSDAVVEYKDDVTNYKHDWADREDKATVVAKETTDQMEIDTREIGYEGEIEREKSERAVIKMTEEYVGTSREEAIYNEHVMFRQKDVITSITDEISEVEYNAEIQRQEYESEVVKIQTEVNTENQQNSNDQYNGVYTTKNYVENEKEKHVTSDPNMDVDRKNMEVYVIDMKVINTNESTKNAWKQEDYNYQTQGEIVVMKDEQRNYMVGADLDRQSMEDKVIEIEETNVAYSTEMKNKQVDNTFDTKEYTNEVKEEIRINNMASDAPRQEMEVVKTEIVDDLSKTQEVFVANQDANTNSTKDYVDENVQEQTEIYTEKEKERQGYEEIVVKLQEDIHTTQSNLNSENQDQSFDTKNYIENKKEETANATKEGENSTIKNQDKVNETAEDLKNRNIKDGEENQVKVNSTEDYLTNMKDEIDTPKEKVYVKNEIGEKYPEGVTEEIYQTKDSRGLLQSYVIRRIVVIQGQGFVYEKTKTRFGTTYSKNGEPITESQWNEDTDNANLVRN